MIKLYGAMNFFTLLLMNLFYFTFNFALSDWELKGGELRSGQSKTPLAEFKSCSQVA
jgi:hypothetical protein